MENKQEKFAKASDALNKGAANAALNLKEKIAASQKTTSQYANEKTRSEVVMELNTHYRPTIEALVPSGKSADQFIQTIGVIASDKLVGCSMSSIIGAALYAASIKLDVAPLFEQVYFSAQKKGGGSVLAKLEISANGWKALALRNKRVSRIEAVPVIKGDKFSFSRGTSPKINHEPAQGLGAKPAEYNYENLEFVYAIAFFADGSFSFEVFDKARIEYIKSKSKDKTSDYSPWKTSPVGMALAKVLKALCKNIPYDSGSHDLITALAADDYVINSTDVTENGISPMDISEGQNVYNMEDAVDDVKVDNTASINAIIDGLRLIHDRDSLGRYWHRLDTDDKKDKDIIALFTAKKIELGG